MILQLRCLLADHHTQPLAGRPLCLHTRATQASILVNHTHIASHTALPNGFPSLTPFHPYSTKHQTQRSDIQTQTGPQNCTQTLKTHASNLKPSQTTAAVRSQGTGGTQVLSQEGLSALAGRGGCVDTWCVSAAQLSQKPPHTMQVACSCLGGGWHAALFCHITSYNRAAHAACCCCSLRSGRCKGSC